MTFNDIHKYTYNMDNNIINFYISSPKTILKQVSCATLNILYTIHIINNKIKIGPDDIDKCDKLIKSLPNTNKYFKHLKLNCISDSLIPAGYIIKDLFKYGLIDDNNMFITLQCGLSNYCMALLTNYTVIDN